MLHTEDSKKKKRILEEPTEQRSTSKPSLVLRDLKHLHAKSASGITIRHKALHGLGNMEM